MVETKKLKFKTPILILSVIALVYMIISLFENYIYIYYLYKYLFSTTIHFRITFFDVITFLLNSIGPILLIIYSLKGKGKAVVPISLIFTFLSDFMVGKLDEGILRLPVFIIFLLTFFAVIGWKSKKKPLIVNLILGIVIEVILLLLPSGLLDGRNLFMFDFTLGLVFKISNLIAYISMEIALFLLFLNDDVCMKNKKAFAYNIEKQLSSLQTRFEMDLITEEEYQAQRMEILKKI